MVGVGKWLIGIQIKNNNVVKLHYMPRFNVGVLLLTVIFIYLVISLYLYMTKERCLHTRLVRVSLFPTIRFRELYF